MAMLPRLRFAGLAVAILGAGLLAWASVAEPAPMWLEDVLRQQPGGAPPERMLARGPAADARYDAERDETVAVMRCSHGWCNEAIALRGDARDLVREESVILRPLEGASLSPQPLGEPLARPHGMGNVTSRLEGTWEATSRAPGVGARLLGVAGVVAGAALLLGRPPMAIGVLASVIALWGIFATKDSAPFILAQVALVPLTLAGGLLAWLARRHTFLRGVGWALLAYAPTLVLLFALRVSSYFPRGGL